MLCAGFGKNWCIGWIYWGMKHLNIKVIGKVQGVMFRKRTLEKAVELGVQGFVRNEPDKSVYIEAEANEAILEVLVAWCHVGSKRAVVEEVIAEEGDVVGLGEFRIVR